MLQPALAVPGAPPAGYVLTTASAGLNSTTVSQINQLAFKPGDPYHLYASRGFSHFVTRYDYNPATGQMSNPLNVVNLNGVADNMDVISGIGFSGDDLWISRWESSNNPRRVAISRMRDLDANGVFEARENFAFGITTGIHMPGHIQILGNSLYIGLGTDTNTGNPDLEEVYNGTIARIGDLANPIAMNLMDSGDRTTFNDSSITDGRLRRFASGFRNPWGIHVTGAGAVWVADNGADTEGSFQETFDLLYRDVRLNDHAHFPPEGRPGGLTPTVDPLAVVGNHVAPTGFDFIPTGPDRGKVLLPLSANATTGRRLITVHPDSGQTATFLTGFTTPTDVTVDPFGRLLIADHSLNAVYLLSPPHDGDANLDRVVNLRDLMALAENWLAPGTWATGDFNGDGFVDKLDLTILARNWQADADAALGPALSSLGLPVVPEPRGILMALLLALTLIRRPVGAGVT